MKVIKKIIIFGPIFIINYKFIALNPTQDGHFWGSSQMRGRGVVKKSPLLKTVTHILLVTVMPYLKKIHKIYVNYVTYLLSPADTSIFIENQKILLPQEIQILKRLGRGSIWPPLPCIFSKTSSRERVETWDFLWILILS